MATYNLVDLCAGTGAFSLAFENVSNDDIKVIPVYSNDFDKNAKIIYDKNFETKLDLKNIHDIDIKDFDFDVDIITAGFPCQPFSIAGKRLGFEDSRSNVFLKILELLKSCKPRIAIFENVKNLLTHDNGNTIKFITKSISKLGYGYKFTIMDTKHHSKIPQNRERIYIICFKYIEDFNKFKFPPKLTHRLNLSDIIDIETDQPINNKYFLTDRLKIWNIIEQNIVKNIETNTIYQYRRVYVRENKNNVCPTLTANMGSGGHNVPLIKNRSNFIRKLTPKECFRLQGFPETYVLPSEINDCGLYKLAGNAVSYSIIKKIAKIIIKILKD